MQVHLIPEGSAILNESFNPRYNLAYILTGVGILVVLAVESATIACFASRHKHGDHIDHSEKRSSRTYSYMTIPEHDRCNSIYEDESGRTFENHDSCHSHNSEVLSELNETTSFRDLLTLYALEFSIAIHSLILGLGFGLETDPATLRALSIAIGMHQLVEGTAMGASIAQFRNQNVLNSCKVMSFIFIFASTISLGVILGMAAGDTATTHIVQGVFDSLAAGSLLYVCLSEQVSSYFRNPAFDNDMQMKVHMILSIAFGFLIMSFLAMIE